jgi:PTS system nitrogen regulatory IIA component
MDVQEFLSYFREEFFIPELKATTKDEVLEEMVQHVASKYPLKDTRLIIDMLKRRERLGSTGIGHGIAIPHGRTLSTPSLLVAFGKSPRGIEYDSIDKKPVHMVFMIVAPPQEESNVYLPFLGKLVEVLQVKHVRDQLMQVTTFQEFIDTLAGGF